MHPFGHLSRVAALLTIGLAFCSKPTKPETIWDISQEGESLWFVQSDHVTITDKFRIKDYSYVTIINNRTFWRDTTRSLTFISSVGDTERVRPFPLHFSVPMIPENHIGGASIYLRDFSASTPDNGVLDVGNSSGTITAIYQHHSPQRISQVIASIKP